MTKYIIRLKTGKQFRADSIEAAGIFYIFKGTWECEEVRVPAVEIEKIWMPYWDWYDYRGSLLDSILGLLALGLVVYWFWWL